VLLASLRNAPLLRHALRSTVRRATSDEVHINTAAAWLLGAQRAGGGGGFAHSFHLLRGWQPPYPETTGYIVPTLHQLFRQSGDPILLESVGSAVAWLKSVQRDDGSFADLYGRSQVFDTGQILLGLSYLTEHAPELSDEGMLARAARWLAAVQKADGSFVARPCDIVSHSYCARVGTALAIAGRLLRDDRLRNAGIANLRWTLVQQKPNGFFRHLSLDESSPPFLHTMVYVIEGLLDGYAEIGDASFLVAASRFAEPLLAMSHRDRGLFSQYNEDFSVAKGGKCLVGLAQWAGVCLSLANLKGDESFRAEGMKTIEFLKRLQIRCGDSRLDGGLWGSDPPWGRYMRFSIPNWGVKFFIDAMLHSGVESGPGCAHG
jgi:hypothetical protein